MSRPLRVFLYTFTLLLIAGSCLVAASGHPATSRLGPHQITRPSISITSPVSNDAWPAMTIRTVSWTYSGPISSDMLDLYLLRDGNPIYYVKNMINLGVNGHGAYDYLLPSPTPPGPNYQIVLVPKGLSPSTAALKGVSKPFTVTQQPSMELLEPNAATVWKSHTTHLIRWKFVGSPGATVRLELLRNGPDLLIATVPIGSHGVGSYAWSIPASIHGSYQLAISSTENSHVFQHISPHFTIKPLTVISTKPDLVKPGLHKTDSIDQLDPQPEPPMAK